MKWWQMFHASSIALVASAAIRLSGWVRRFTTDSYFQNPMGNSTILGKRFSGSEAIL